MIGFEPRRRIIFVLFSVSFALANSEVHAFAESDRPNILFILTDDQSCSSLSCYGGSLVKTVHLDGLAEDGLRFTDAYVMPQCTPTRAALLTGQHTARSGMWHVIPWYGTPYAPVLEPLFREELLPTQCRLPRMLQSSGYHTGMGGKWHLTTNREQGYYTHLFEGAASEFGFHEVAPAGEGSQNEGDKWVDHLTDHAIDFIKAHSDTPWFYYLSHHTLHGVVSAPPDLVKEYLDDGAPENGFGNATYLAAIEHLDASVGRLLAALDETGQRDNTIVVFLADNGGVDTRYHHTRLDGKPADDSAPLAMRDQQLESAPLREGKGSMYEGGIRVPCMVCWPDQIRPGQVSRTPIHVVDWLPTLLEAANHQSDQPEDGVSLLSLFRGETLPERSLYWYLPLYDLRWAATPCSIMRRGDWKLIEFYGDWFDEDKRYHTGHRVELYNLANDIGERNDLSSKHPERVESMQRQLSQWLSEMDIEPPRANPHFDPSRALLETRDKPAFLQGRTFGD
ncbi:MAG: sulfatase [Planctomycetota bacterium]